MPKRFKYKIKGIVQGVGFRPFVFRAAREHRICGFVLNRGDCVLIEAEGDDNDLTCFEDELKNNAPKLSKINHFEKKSITPKFAKWIRIT